MKCEICKSEMEVIVLLPIKKQDGCLNTLACLKCAEESSAYCKKHETPHIGFTDDDTTACMHCIEELIKKEEPLAIGPEGYVTIVLTKLPSEEKRSLIEWADLSSAITGNSREICILRALATKALRSGMPIGKVVKKVLEDSSVDFILPKLAYL